MNRVALTLVALGATLASPVLAQMAAPRGAPPTAPVASMNPTKPTATAPAPAMSHPEGTASTAMRPPVNVNTATAAELDAVPQIGPKRASAIIAHRPYSSPADLVTKKALSQGIYDKVKTHLTTG